MTLPASQNLQIAFNDTQAYCQVLQKPAHDYNLNKPPSILGVILQPFGGDPVVRQEVVNWLVLRAVVIKDLAEKSAQFRLKILAAQLYQLLHHIQLVSFSLFPSVVETCLSALVA